MNGIAIDITERKRADEELRMATERFQVALRGSSVVVFNQDRDLRYTWIHNPGLGYSSSQVIGKRDIEIFRREDGEVTEALKRDVIQSGITRRQEVTIQWDGSNRVYDLLVDPLKDSSGTITGVTCAAVDITESKRIEAELRQSREELERRVADRTRELGETLEIVQSQIVVRQKTEDELRELSARVLNLQDEERRRIARDLHDSVGQTLTAIKMSLSALEQQVRDTPDTAARLQELNLFTDQALQEIRTTSHLLHPPLLDEVGFSSAARWYFEGFSKRSGIQVALDLSAAPTLHQDTALALFRVLQESLVNIVRHSGSKSVEVRLYPEGENAVLSIRDHGKGIAREKLESFHRTGSGVGIGLAGMRQRLHHLGGRLKVVSDATGTTVSAVVPLKAKTSGNTEAA